MELLEKKDITINNIIFDIEQNVKDVFVDINTGKKEYILYENIVNKKELSIFFLFEVPFHEAFSHWVFESAVFLPFIKHFIHYENFFILVNKNNCRKYKKTFFKLFNIEDKNICYIDNTDTYTTNVSYKNIPKNNISIVCRNFIMVSPLHTLNSYFADKFLFLLSNFYNVITKEIHYEKNIEHLVLPRSKTENYLPNDRQICYNNIFNLLKDKEYMWYDTKETNNFIDQVQIIQKSKNIYSYLGSSYLVNGFFSRGSNIYLVTTETEYNYHNNLLIKIIVDIIEKHNKIVLI